jgi:TonB family protein
VKPQYTQAARDARIEGVVLLEGLVLADGQVADVRILRSRFSAPVGRYEAIKQALRRGAFARNTEGNAGALGCYQVELSFRMK